MFLIHLVSYRMVSVKASETLGRLETKSEQFRPVSFTFDIQSISIDLSFLNLFLLEKFSSSDRGVKRFQRDNGR